MSQADERDDEFRAMGELSQAFSTLVDHLTQRRSVSLDVSTLVTLAASTVPRTQHAGLVAMRDGQATTVASTSDLVSRLDDLRSRLGEGVALDVLECNDIVNSGDLANDPRYPEFGPAAVAECDVVSMLAYRLHLGRARTAALILVSDWPFAFDGFAEAIGAMFAAYCSLALISGEIFGEQVSQQRAFQVEREIGTAVGILLSQENLSPAEAYHRLHSASTRATASLHSTAQHVIEHRQIPSE